MSTQPGIGLAVALALLLGVAVAAAQVGRLGVSRPLLTAAARATVQLAGVAVILTAVLARWAWVGAFVAVMFAVAVGTSSRRIGAGPAWPWAALAMGAGVAPVLAVLVLTRAVPLTGLALIPLAGITIGGAMTAHSLTGRRLFAVLREEHSSYEAGLSIGLSRAEAIEEITRRRVPEALVPALDQTRTVGLVTLPGAFAGVLLGGGTPLQAGAAEILVLVGLLAAETVTVVVAHQLVRAGRLLPVDLRERLRP